MVTSRRAGARRGTDLRLLLPAVVAWAGVAALLGRSGGELVTVAGGSAAVGLAALSVVVVRLRSGRSGAIASTAGVVGLCALLLALTVSALAAASTVRDAGPVRDLAAQRAVITASATIESDPRLLVPPRGRPESASSVLIRVTVEQVGARGAESSVQAPVLAFGDRSWLETRWQQRVLITGRLAPAADAGDDVVAVLTPTRPPEILAEPGIVAELAQRVRSRFAEATDGLPADARGLLPGLVIGDTSRTPPDLDDAMLVTGMTHLSAVSGANVT